MIKIWTAPAGKIIQGHVLDVSKKGLERALKDYDELLYVRWNPKKLKGHGVWEIRRRPLLKAIKQQAEIGKDVITELGYVEQDVVHHVLDVPYLNYSVLTKLHKMDMFKYNMSYFGEQVDSNLDSYESNEKIKARKEMLYHAKQQRRTFQELREMVLSGWNPAEIADHWK